MTDNRADYIYQAEEYLTGGIVYVDLSDLLEEAKDASTSADSEELTKKLIQRITENANSDRRVQEHYTRFKADNSDPYKLFVYDYRDYTSDQNDDRYGYTVAPDTSKDMGRLDYLSGNLYLKGIELYTESVSYVSRDPLRIQHGNEVDNCSFIDLPDLNAMFDIYSKYGYKDIKSSLTLVEKIPARQYTEAGSYTQKTISVQETTQKTAKFKIHPSQTVWENGERKTTD